MDFSRFHSKGRAFLSGVALSLAACASAEAPEAPAVAKPALWKIADEDTTIYLFGTVHLLPKGLAWRSPALERAIASSDTLVTEIILPEDPAAMAQVMSKMAVSPGLPPLAERVPAEKKEALDKAVATSGLPAPALDRLESWAAALALIQGAFQKLGLDPEIGAEKSLTANYKGKKHVALETPEQQLAFFDTLPEEAQRLLLASAIEDSATANAQFKAMLDAWAAGDVDAIARTFDDETALSPDLRAALMTKRNAAWAEWLEKRMDEPGTVMVAVGAGHLAGADSVQGMLEAKGIKVERVQ
ncbi:TraB/GumN family protein [Allosphingosinicella vermicomposti]|uniref:TraB/GumN family protein n=1 Tax=Allosphingosinicella vermicomposti TaxID=614671 RepID=UPI001FE22819|nr:TraB/GumN family protein [Allosphingosinicella vermicomposti]